MFIKNEYCTIYFGGIDDSIHPAMYNQGLQSPLLEHSLFSHLKDTLHIDDLYFGLQVHGTQGLLVDQDTVKSINSFTLESDYLITKTLNLGIGVMTADCLPIVIIDQIEMIAAIIHAGWKGLLAGIVPVAINDLITNHGCDAKNLHVFIGPHARDCCYEIQPDFLKNFSCDKLSSKTITQRDDALYFSLIQYTLLECNMLGISSDAINTTRAHCTMCSTSFCSSRKQGTTAKRNMTIVALL